MPYYLMCIMSKIDKIWLSDHDCGGGSDGDGNS